MDAKAWSMLFEEWNYRKEGLKPEEIFGKPRGLKLDADMVSTLMAENIVKTEACFKAVLRKAILDQGTELMKLRLARSDAEKAGDAEAAHIFELKMKEILLSQAAVWNRMSRDQQNLLLKELPPEADWWLAIAAAEQLNESAGRPAPDPDNPDRVVIGAKAAADLNAVIFLDATSERIKQLIVELKRRATDSPIPAVMNVAPTPR
jgi:hypothetical protein